MRALSELLKARDKFQLWQAYMAEISWAGAKASYKEFPIPSYLEMTKEKAPRDTRTAEQIREGLLARLNKDVNT